MSTQPDAEIQALLDDLWKRHLPSLTERISILERAAAEGASGTLPEPLRAEAQSVAHKLAGNLGMFGHHEAGEAAGRIEEILKSPAPDALTSLASLTTLLSERLAPHLAPRDEQPATNN